MWTIGLRRYANLEKYGGMIAGRVLRDPDLSRARYAALGCLLVRSAASIGGEDFEYLARELSDVGIRIQAH